VPKVTSLPDFLPIYLPKAWRHGRQESELKSSASG